MAEGSQSSVQGSLIFIYEGVLYALADEITEQFIAELGDKAPAQVARLSNVVYNSMTRMWDVVDRLTSTVLHSGPVRDICIRWEVQYYNNLFLENPHLLKEYAPCS